MDLKSKIRTIPDFPKKGVMFRDITTLIKDKDAFHYVIDQFTKRYKNKDIDIIAGIESRGFIFGGALAYALNKPFVPIRKPGKLPYKTKSREFEKEYGTDEVEIHVDAIKTGDKVLIIDDLIALGGTCKGAIELVECLGGKIVECAFIIELPELGGREKLKGYTVFSLVSFKEEEK